MSQNSSISGTFRLVVSCRKKFWRPISLISVPVAVKKHSRFFYSMSDYRTSTGKAEVDFICQAKGAVVPLEAKAGINPRSKSLRVFQEKCSPRLLTRTTLLNFRKDGGICNFPL